MIIQCEQCQTRYRLDDSKVTDKGVRVRCVKCKHVFAVKQEQAEAVEPQTDFGALLDESVSSGNEAEATAPPDSLQATPAFESSPEPSVASAEDDFSILSLEEDRGFAPDQDKTRPTDGEVDFASFDFGDLSVDTDKRVVAAVPAPMTMMQPQVSPPEAVDEDSNSFDFGDEVLFGDAVVAPVTDEPTEPITFDFQMDEFADSMGGETANGDVNKAGQEEDSADEPFSLGEIDFGDELTSVAVQQVHPDDLQPSQELLFAPLAEAQIKPIHSEEDTLKTGSVTGSPQADQEELPPLSIASRRKQNPILGRLIMVVLLIVVAALGFLGYSTFTEDKGKGVAENGRITVRSVEASIVENQLIGDLLVITGEAVNEYPKPRAAIQIKGMVYGASGQVLFTKNAYCGNPLTKEQLATLPTDKIEAAMANQFGDSLANMEVAAGKAIPFVIVISKIPAEAKDYGVESVGSTVATGK